MFKNLLLLVIVFCYGLTFAQETNKKPVPFSNSPIAPIDLTSKDLPKTTCGTVEASQALIAMYPQMGSEEDFEKLLKRAIEERKAKTALFSMEETVLTLPVVVHVVHDDELLGEGANISYEQILSQIEVLNEDFRKMTGTPGFNDNPVGADIRIEFELAVVDPKGIVLEEKGVDRVNLKDLGYSGQPSRDQVDPLIKTVTYWDPFNYLNIWVVDIAPSGGSQTLGYAQFPTISGLPGLDNLGLPTGMETDGVVLIPSVFGSNDKGNFDLWPGKDKGRTATHEVGHYLGLRHIWGDGDCDADDYCEDTPLQDGYTANCEQTFSCGSQDMIENYMDYTDDVCMNIFTQDQKDRIWAVMENSPRRKELLNSYALTPEPEFVANKTTVWQGESVYFSDLSSGTVNAWSWEFEGGEPAASSEQNPEVVYSDPGVYKVSLSVGNAAGQFSEKRTKFSYIKVKETQARPEADFYTVKTKVLTGEEVQFEDFSKNDPISWYWEFEGGNPAFSTEQNPKVRFNEVGEYSVSLKVANFLGESEVFSKENLIKVSKGAEIVVNPKEFQETLKLEETITGKVTIENSGEKVLNYTLSSYRKDLQGVAGSNNVYNGGKGEYVWYDSRSPLFSSRLIKGVAHEWLEISEIGTEHFTENDDEFTIELPFDFPFFGENNRTVYVGNTGYISLTGDRMSDYSPDPIPTFYNPNGFIAPLWTDIEPKKMGRIYHLIQDNALIVQYSNFSYYDMPETDFTFQVILYASGEILFQYKDMELNGLSPSQELVTIGVENKEGTSGTQISRQLGYPEKNLAVLLYPHQYFDQEEGQLEPGESTVVNYTPDLSDLSPGDYEFAINVQSNDYVNSDLEIPFKIHLNGEADLTVNQKPSFGEVFLGGAQTDVLNLENSGTEVLEIDLVIEGNGFSLKEEEGSFRLAVGESRDVEISFGPTELGENSGILTIDSNDPDQPQKQINLTGMGLPAPSVNIPVASIKQLTPHGQVNNSKIVIDNSGGQSDLEFSLGLNHLIYPIGGKAQRQQHILVIQESKEYYQYDFWIGEWIEEQFGFATTTISSEELSSTVLEDFDLIITSEQQEQEYYSNLNRAAGRFESYLETGKTILFLNYNRENESLTLPGGVEYKNEIFDVYWDIDVDLPDHPVMAGVDMDLYRFEDNLVNLPKGTQIIASGMATEEGVRAINLAEYNYNGGRVLATAMQPIMYYYLYVNYKDPLFSNLVNYALKATPINFEETSGIVPPGEARTIKVNFDAKDMAGGEFSTDLLVYTNDPLNEEVLVPVSWEVTGAEPNFFAEQLELDYGDIFLGDSIGQILTLHNKGANILGISDLSSSSHSFSAGETSFQIAPNASFELPISFQPTEISDFNEIISFKTNDKEAEEVIISVTGSASEGPYLGFIAQETVALEIGENGNAFVVFDNFDGKYQLEVAYDSTLYGFIRPEESIEQQFDQKGGFNAINGQETPGHRLVDEGFPHLLRSMVSANGDIYILDDGKVLRYDEEYRKETVVFEVGEDSRRMGWDGENFWIGTEDGELYQYSVEGDELAGPLDTPVNGYVTPVWDGERLIVFEPDRGTNFYALDKEGNVLAELKTGDFDFTVSSMSYDHEQNLGILSNGTELGKLHFFTLEGDKIKITEELIVPLPYQFRDFRIYGLLLKGDKIWYSFFRVPYLFEFDNTVLEFYDWLDTRLSGRFNRDIIQMGDSSKLSFEFNALDGMEIGTHICRLYMRTNDPRYKNSYLDIALEVLNSAPQVLGKIPDQTLILDQDTYSIDLDQLFTDVNVEDTSLDYDIKVSSENVIESDLFSGNLTINPLNGGEVTVFVTGRDSGGESESLEFNVTVIDPDNSIPEVIGSLDHVILELNDEFNLNLVDLFADADGDLLIYEVNAGQTTAADVSLKGSVLEIIPLEVTSGIPIMLTADDRRGGTAEINFTLEIGVIMGLGDEVLTTETKMYPNPTDGFLIIKLAESMGGDVNLSFNNIMGKQVYAHEAIRVNKRDLTVDVSALPAGVYFVEITAGKAKTVKRLIKR
ncbi:choice-of-anchor D domain-containing protein [Xanthovirga aplysinae]|uniref:Ig-like domain-containing protein n=1 Tax=Xanthovirga aplysinae TaxID=2529853 RepID=UPI0012BB92A0|nr:choice-of-anchor D domain-containing protein [Xanthovirga aplysinae]MTI31079.1 choice-of-anchor D domain-containing protein [Xanthovirga aplysinae]